MLKQFITIFAVLLLITKLWHVKAYADVLKIPFRGTEFLTSQVTGYDRGRPGYDTTGLQKTPFSKIEFLTSQLAGIGHGRPGTEEFLNADVIVKLKEDSNLYGLSLTFFDTNGPNTAMLNTLIAALVYDLSVEISYYEKAGTKQVVKVTVRK